MNYRYIDGRYVRTNVVHGKDRSVKNTQKLTDYLAKKLDSIYAIYASFENDLSNNKINLANSGFSEEDISQAYHRLEYIEGNLFRQAMLIMVCSYLEEAMNLIGKRVISDYTTKIRKINGNWFEKRKNLFNEIGVMFNEIKDECDRIDDLRIVRNCIVHAGGSITRYRYQKQVEAAVERIKERDKDKNMNLVEISADKFLYLGDNIIATAIIASEQIIKHCSNGEPK